jgi:regulator of sirC expression with transglutaminase-like and TPR domain
MLNNTSMNALLISEISSKNVDLVKALSLLEQYIFEENSQLVELLNDLEKRCKTAVAKEQDVIAQVEAFLDFLFIEQLWMDKKQPYWPLISYIPSKALLHHSIAPALKLVLLQHLAQVCGFEVDIVYVPETLMVRIICDEDYAVIFDPITGEAINWQSLDQRMNELPGNPLERYLEGETNQKLLCHYLTVLKNTLIMEQQFQAALRCVDVLLQLRPDDPIERRDRGFLLHQLDCFKVAYDDYKYFVEQCPEDPAAQLLKLQLENIKISDNVLH